MKTYAMVLLDTGYRNSTRRNIPTNRFDDPTHTHVALDVAEQGATFCNMLPDRDSQALTPGRETAPKRNVTGQHQ